MVELLWDITIFMKKLLHNYHNAIKVLQGCFHLLSGVHSKLHAWCVRWSDLDEVSFPLETYAYFWGDEGYSLIECFHEEIEEKLHDLQDDLAEFKVTGKATFKLKSKATVAPEVIIEKADDLEEHVIMFQEQTDIYFDQINVKRLKDISPQKLAIAQEQSRRPCLALNTANPSRSVKANLGQALRIEGLRAQDLKSSHFWKHISDASTLYKDLPPKVLIELIREPSSKQLLRLPNKPSEKICFDYAISYDAQHKSSSQSNSEHERLLKEADQPTQLLLEQASLVRTLLVRRLVSHMNPSDRKLVLVRTKIERYRLAVALVSCFLLAWSPTFMESLCTCKINS